MSRNSFLLLSLLFFVVGFFGSSFLRQKVRLNKYEKMEESFRHEKDSLIFLMDSLNCELMTKSIDIGRYEIIMDRVWALDSPLVEKITKNLE